jgi:glycosyltransferase involved in cell wall biosynthesis
MSDILSRKKILIQTDFTLAKTGFGKNAKNIFEYLYKTNKYELVHFAVGSVEMNPELGRTPWKSLGCVNPEKLQQLKQQQDPRNWENIDRLAGYGAYSLDEVVKAEKPDVFIAIQDIWGINFSVDKPWFKAIPSVLWTTLDSLPILPNAVEIAPKAKHYWSWADFATKALHDLGNKHVRTVRGAVETKHFSRLTDKERLELRQKFNIPEGSFIVGFVFRNQLRKSVPNLLQGFKIFKKDCPQAKLLLHTSWSEGWDIPKLMQETGIDPNDVLTTYVCPHCHAYEVKPFIGQHVDCRFCGAKGNNPNPQNQHPSGQVTTHPTIGVNEKQLNEVYNLMDVYAHPFTSGGQEIPIQEAKLTELITLVTNYSCGEDLCVEAAGSLTLDWAEYREPGTQFIKASTYPSSIAKQLNRVHNMKPEARRELGKRARKWTIDNFSVEVIGKILEDFIDSQEPHNFDFTEKYEPRDPYFNLPEIADNEKWLVAMYDNILKRKERDENGIKYWLGELNRGAERKSIENFFRQTALNENNQNNQITFDQLLNKNDKGRVLLSCKESAGDVFLVTALFKSIKERYPDWTLYVATKKEFKDIIDGNPYVDKWLEWNPLMDNLVWAEGNHQHNGFFDICYVPTVVTQNAWHYTHNGKDKIDFKIRE